MMGDDGVGQASTNYMWGGEMVGDDGVGEAPKLSHVESAVWTGGVRGPMDIEPREKALLIEVNPWGGWGRGWEWGWGWGEVGAWG